MDAIYAVIAKTASGKFKLKKDNLTIVEARKMLVTFDAGSDPKIVQSVHLKRALALNNG